MTTTVRPQEQSVMANGLRLHYLDWGGEAAVPALAFHGFALNSHSWDEVAPRLRDRLRLLAFDQRGHGLSDRAQEMSDYNRDSMVSDIAQIIATLKLERPVIIGHSMGGINALTFAARYPDQVRALVLADVGPQIAAAGASEVQKFVSGPYELESLDAWVEHTHKYYPHRSKERIRERLTVSLSPTPQGALAKQYDERFRNNFIRDIEASEEQRWESARALRCPTLLIRGGDSPVLTAEGAERFAREIAVVRLVTIPGAAHSVAGDKPEEFTAAVRAFLDDVLGK